jgi:hypothetical protein
MAINTNILQQPRPNVTLQLSIYKIVIFAIYCICPSGNPDCVLPPFILICHAPKEARNAMSREIPNPDEQNDATENEIKVLQQSSQFGGGHSLSSRSAKKT